MKKITLTDIHDISLGTVVLGTGGGGDPTVGRLATEHFYKKNNRESVPLVSADELPDDAFVLPFAFFGSPMIFIEKLVSEAEIINLITMAEKYYGRKIDAVMPAEAGGLNCIFPFAIAAHLGVPVVDADGMGRAYPRLEMVSFTLYDIPATPVCHADEKGNQIVYNTITNEWAENFITRAVILMGGTSVITCFPMTAKQVREAAILGPVSKSMEIGIAIREARKNKKDPVQSILDVTNGFKIFKGKITDVVISTEGRWNKGKCTMEGLDDYSGETMTLDFQNEFLIARDKQGTPMAIVPDLIAMVDSETGTAITAERLRYGIRASVIAIPCDKKWRTEKGVLLGGPSKFGYTDHYQPIENIYSTLKK